MRFRLFALLVAGGFGLLFAQGVNAGTCSGTCDISLSGGGFTSRSTRYPGYSDSDCRARCVNSCYDFGFPQGSMFTCRDVSYQESAGDAQVRRAATRPGQPVGGTGSTGAAQQQIPSLPTTSAQAGDTCVVTCSNPTAENVQQYLAPASLRVTTQEACLSYCTTHCPTTGATTDRISCLAAHYQPPDAAQAGSTSGATGVSTSTLSTLAASSGSSGSCSGYGGVHDPFCGKSFSTIAGEIIKVLIGVAGVLFLGMLFYGGAQWMMAGDSEDGVKDGRTTIRNAIVGIALVMLSYTLVQLVVTLSGSVGATQGGATVITPSTTETPGAPTIDTVNPF